MGFEGLGLGLGLGERRGLGRGLERGLGGWRPWVQFYDEEIVEFLVFDFVVVVLVEDFEGFVRAGACRFYAQKFEDFCHLVAADVAITVLVPFRE